MKQTTKSQISWKLSVTEVIFQDVKILLSEILKTCGWICQMLIKTNKNYSVLYYTFKVTGLSASSR